MRTILLYLTALAFAASGLVVPSAYAGNEPVNNPPVAVTDFATVMQGMNGKVVVAVLDNDSDPDGDDFWLCGVHPIPNKYGDAVQSGQKVVINPNGQNGTAFETTYSLCSRGFMIKGTLKVKVDKIRKLYFVKKHGYYVAHNPNPRSYLGRFTFGYHKQNVTGNFYMLGGKTHKFKAKPDMSWWGYVDLPDGGVIDAGKGKLH